MDSVMGICPCKAAQSKFSCSLFKGAYSCACWFKHCYLVCLQDLHFRWLLCRGWKHPLPYSFQLFSNTLQASSASNMLFVTYMGVVKWSWMQIVPELKPAKIFSIAIFHALYQLCKELLIDTYICLCLILFLGFLGICTDKEFCCFLIQKKKCL